MHIVLDSILPTYISNDQVSSSEIFLREKVMFESPKKYLINANSGVGKTSFLNLIFAINFSYNGDILYDNINIKSNSNLIQKLRKETISYVFQDFKLFPNISAIDNINLKNNLTNYKTNSQISEMFEYCGIFEQKDKLVKNLSRGQKQRVAIIRSLCQPFNFLLLDEPFSHLDATNTAKVVSLINSEVSKRSASLIMTDLRINSFFNYDKIYKL